MKVIISERQLSNILKSHGKKKDLDEVETTTPEVTQEPSISTAGTSTTGAPTTGTPPATYPEVGHWESGLTRGPANQLANTKWSDTVGSKITRGHANQLK
jgi:hypothetical protein